ncbi:S-layer homology domain-containing protein [Sporosarcina siberiensis]|uniref:S-layer homology domain-containing protein n=1 Tax=Sporosarcina siberiensis TaxID=1365606 RepID=A0ABW4SIG9_9BACL
MNSFWKIIFIMVISLDVLLGMDGSLVSNKAMASADNLALNKPVASDSTLSTLYPTANAVDGNDSTFWFSSNGAAFPRFLSVDLGEMTTIGRWTLTTYIHRNADYELQTSIDGVTYTSIMDNAGTSVTSNLSNHTNITLDHPITSRYIRVLFTANVDNTTLSSQISEFGLYAPAAPDAPLSVIAVAGNGKAEISFNAGGSTGGSAITNYTVTSLPEGITATGSSSPLTVTDLTNGTPYTFTVTATNSIGTSVGSDPSSTITPKSNNTTLNSFDLSDITLNPSVSGNVYDYIGTVLNNVSDTTATYVTDDSQATVVLHLNGTPVNNPINLSVGSNIISYVVTAQDGTKKTYTVNVTRPQLIDAIVVSSVGATMYVGESLQFNANVTPINATDQTFSWSVIPGTGAATINADGILVSTQAGTITVQATSHDGSGVVGGKVVTINNRPSGHDNNPTPIVPKPIDPTPISELFNLSVGKGDVNVVKYIETLVQEANRTSITNNFSDAKGHWAEKSIDTFLKLQMIKGYSDGNFKPDSKITRAEFAVILGIVFDIKGIENAGPALRDIGNHWAKGSIENLTMTGVITGYEDGTFRPNNTISREEMVAMLARILNLNNASKDNTKGDFDDLEGSFAANEIKAAVQTGIINGQSDGKFNPKNNVTRAQALTSILNALKLHPQLATLLDSLN